MTFGEPSRWTKLYEGRHDAIQSTQFPDGYDPIEPIDVGGPYSYEFLACKGIILNGLKSQNLAGRLIQTTTFVPDATNVLELQDDPILHNRLILTETFYSSFNLRITVPYWLEHVVFYVWGFNKD